MSRLPTTRPLLLAVLLLGLAILPPAQATAFQQALPLLSAAEHLHATPGFFSQFWNFLSVLWSENGSGLDPNGATGDNGSILEPNG